jgi:ribosomal protein S18 acetylase RimI-like enzyme
MEIIDLRQIRSQALRDLFTAEKDEWALTLNWDYSEPQRVISIMIDTGALPGFAAFDGAYPLGYAFYVAERSTALIGGCFVRKSHEALGLEERLLTEVLRAVKASPAMHRIEAQFIGFRGWALDDFFANHGFSRFGRCFMRRTCELAPASLESERFAVRTWNLQDLESAAQLTVDAYQSVIDRQITCHYLSLEFCREFLNNLVFRPGCGSFLPEASYCARNLDRDDLIGYVLTSRISAREGHIPQIAVSRRYQGQGVGSGLLRRAVRYLGLNGYQTVSLTVTEENQRAVSLYRRFGFIVHRRFAAFVWVSSG